MKSFLGSTLYGLSLLMAGFGSLDSDESVYHIGRFAFDLSGMLLMLLGVGLPLIIAVFVVLRLWSRRVSKRYTREP